MTLDWDTDSTLESSQTETRVETDSTDGTVALGEFDDFDDNSFDSAKWDKVTPSGSVTETNQQIEITTDGTDSQRTYLRSAEGLSDGSNGEDVRVTLDLKRNDANDNDLICLWWDGSGAAEGGDSGAPDNAVVLQIDGINDALRIRKWESGSITNLATDSSFTPDQSASHTWDFRLTGTFSSFDAEAFRDGTSMLSTTGNSFSPGSTPAGQFGVTPREDGRTIEVDNVHIFWATGTYESSKQTASTIPSELSTSATIPSTETVDVTVNEDTNGDGTVDNSQTATITDGSDSVNLTGFEGRNSDVWWTAEFNPSSGGDVTDTPRVDSASIRLGKAIAASGTGVGTGSAALNRGRTLAASGTGTGTGSAVAVVVHPDDWVVGSIPLHDVTTIDVDARGLTLSARVDAEIRSLLRRYAAQAGSVTVIDEVDGSWTAIDRSHSGVSPTLEVPDGNPPPFRSVATIVRRYSETRMSRAATAFDLNLEFVYQSSREPNSNAPTETRASDEWLLNFDSGQIALSAVDVEQVNNGERQRLTCTITPTQLTAVMDSAAYPAGATVRTVPGGDDWAVDESSGDRQTVTVTPPDDRQGTTGYPEGDYVILDWSAELVAPQRYRLQLGIREKGG